MLDSLATQSLNHLLAQSSWARERLIPFSGKCARFECPPFTAALAVRPDGQIEYASHAVPDVTICLTPGLAMRLAARDEAAWKEVAITGNTDFAEALGYVFRNLRWDVEEDLSRVFGDIAAHRMVEAGETLRQAPYGLAAMEALKSAGLWDEIKPKLVYGENIRQALLFVEAGNAEAGIIARSIAQVPGIEYAEVPVSLHKPISQAAGVVSSSKEKEGGRAFIKFVNGPKGRPLMKKFGFLPPTAR